MPPDLPKRGVTKGKGAIRDKQGCYTCRIRRKKCDGQPDASGRCSTCVRLRLECLGFGEKRPEWLRNPDMVNELREKIKRFLAAQGMIKSHSAPTSFDTPELATHLTYAPDKYVSDSPQISSSDWNMDSEYAQPPDPDVNSDSSSSEEQASRIEEPVSNTPYSSQKQSASHTIRAIHRSQIQTSSRRPSSEHIARQIDDNDCTRTSNDVDDPPPPSASEESSSTLGSLVARLRSVFGDVNLYEQLLGCREAQAQKVLDLLQELLDTAGLDADFKRNLMVTTQRLSKASGLFPTCYSLGDVHYADDPVAAGSIADIYKGSLRGRAVRVKVIRRYPSTRVEHFLKKYAKEALLWGQLAHPNICPVYGLYRHDTRICLVSPWMDNENLPDYVRGHPKPDRLLLVCDAAQGLAYLHENEIIHGDLKGTNILVSASGRARLTDFGLSSVSDTNISAWTPDSTAESGGRSVRWQASELSNFETGKAVPNSKTSDIYAFSLVCYETYIKTNPFEYSTYDASSGTLQVKIVNTPPRPPYSSLVWSCIVGLTERIWSIMTDCWNADPSLRPTAHQLVESLALGLDQSRRSTNDDTLSAAQFRKEVGGHRETMSVEAFERLMGISPLLPETARLEESNCPASQADESNHNDTAASPHSDQSGLKSGENQPDMDRPGVSKWFKVVLA